MGAGFAESSFYIPCWNFKMFYVGVFSMLHAVVGNSFDSTMSIRLQVFIHDEGFVTFEAQRKSKCAKALFSVANFIFFFVAEHWHFKGNCFDLFVTISFECCCYFLAHVAC